MERNLYVNALLADPVLAVTVQEALQDGQIDRAAAELAWRLIGRERFERRDGPE